MSIVKTNPEEAEAKNDSRINESPELFEVIYVNIYGDVKKYFRKIKLPAEESCVLYIWSKSCDLDVTMRYINKWGFKCFESQVLEWTVSEELSLFELLLICVKGSDEEEPCLLRVDLVHKEQSGITRPRFYNKLIEKDSPDTRYLEISNIQTDNQEEYCNRIFVKI